MENERRKCIVTEHGKQTKGYFMELGKASQYTDSNDSYQVSVAIVEQKDGGRIRKVDPECVTFKEWED